MHELPDVKDLFEVIANERQILPVLVEKDYWIMHCLWGLQQQGFQFALKGGTSLSKGFNIIERFSEDIDIQVYPNAEDNLPIGKNQDKPKHIESRRKFFDTIADLLIIPEIKFCRDYSFDDNKKMRNAGIRGEYPSSLSSTSVLKEGIIFELGFDNVTPNLPCDITSWAFEKAFSLSLSIVDNRAKQVLCYCPEYTFVEKLQTISTKYRLQQEQQSMPVNFLRHYYDVYKLLENKRVLDFIGSEEYFNYKIERFRSKDEINLSKNSAFSIPDMSIRNLYAKEFQSKSALYIGDQPKFFNIVERINRYLIKM